MSLIRRAIAKACRQTGITSDLLAIYCLSKSNEYLKQVGWFQSFRKCLPVDKNGQAIPWYTYAAIAFLENRIRQSMSVFEYGSGYSTIWWSSRVSKVVSCEHNEKWYQLMSSKLPDNVGYLHCDVVPGGDYSKAIQKLNREFDIVVIDGKERVNCAKNSLDDLKPDGVIVWDNSDREKYREGYDYLIANGFKRLDFWGLGPIGTCGWCTSVFYRSENCLGI